MFSGIRESTSRGAEHAFGDVRGHVDFQNHRVGDLQDRFDVRVNVFLQRVKLRLMRNRSGQIAVGIQNRHPDAHAAFAEERVRKIHAQLGEMFAHVATERRGIGHADEHRLFTLPGERLADVAAHAAVHDAHMAHVAPGRDVFHQRKALDVDEYCADDGGYEHGVSLLKSSERFQRPE